MAGASLLIPAVALLTVLLPGCGFGDELTRRGFIQSGDQICSETIGKTRIESEQAAEHGQPLSQTEVVRSLAQSYGAAAPRLRNLEVSDDDVAMRDRMAEAFRETASRLDLAGRSPTGDAGATQAAIGAITDLKPLGRAIRAYGFDLCGGRPGGP